MTAARVSLVAIAVAACAPRVMPETAGEHAACVSALRAFASLDAQRFEPLPSRCTLADADTAFPVRRNAEPETLEPDRPEPQLYNYRGRFPCTVWLWHGRIGAVDHRMNDTRDEHLANASALGPTEDGMRGDTHGEGLWFARGFRFYGIHLRMFGPTTPAAYREIADRFEYPPREREDEGTDVDEGLP